MSGVGTIVSKGVDLGELAVHDGLVYIVVSKEIADGFRDWTGPFEFRLSNDNRHPRLRQMTLRPVRGPEPRARGKKGSGGQAVVKKTS